MKREDVKKILGEAATDEMIQGIMDLHKIDADASKKLLQDKQSEIDAANTKITELTDSLKKFDGVDVDALNNKIKEIDDKYKAQIDTLKKTNAIELAVKDYKPKNEKMLISQLDQSIIKLNEDGTVTGLVEQIENIKKDNAFLFEAEDPTPEDVDLGGNHQGGGAEPALSWESALNDHYK